MTRTEEISDLLKDFVCLTEQEKRETLDHLLELEREGAINPVCHLLMATQPGTELVRHFKTLDPVEQDLAIQLLLEQECENLIQPVVHLLTPLRRPLDTNLA